METIRTWQKVTEAKYIFSVGEKKVGALELVHSKWNRTALLDVEGQLFAMTQSGFWKNKLQITDYKGNLVLKTLPKKWFSSTTVIEYQNEKLQLKIRNNPMAELVILKNEEEVLSYGLKTVDKKIVTQIKSSQENKDYLLDFLLWFLFRTIAHENSGEEIVFQTLVMTS